MEERVLQELVARARGKTAAFDADGTIWADDLGESFLRALEEEGLVERGAYGEYERRHASDPVDAYGYAVTAMAGLEEATIRARALAFFSEHFEPRIFPEVRRLIDALHDAQVRIAVVSASGGLLIEPASRALGISCAAGVEVEREAGLLTERLVRPLPVDEGKVHWATRLLGAPPTLAVGNGVIDLALLCSAEVALVVESPGAPQSPLVEEGRRRGFFGCTVEHPCPTRRLP